MHKSGFVNIIGKPNVGKSTFLNAIMGEKFSIVTSKPQTTRHRILLIYNDEEKQIVFSDLPGLIDQPGYELQKSMNKYIFSSFEDADALIYITDIFEDFNLNEIFIQNIKQTNVPKYLIINKLDLATEDKIEELTAKWKEIADFNEIIALSAKEGFEKENIIDLISQDLPESPPFYPKDQVSDRTERFFIEEIIREKILLLYKKEVPYSVQVIVEDWLEKINNKNEKLLYIRAIIFVSRKSQKHILIGKQGSMIKKLGSESRKDIEEFLQRKIYLDLTVKELEDWRNDENALRNLGY